MISIIVSTYKPENFIAFSENIKSNIGVEYEIIKIENNGKYGLCEAYNIGIEQAKYKYICFSHDDVEINRENWGQYVIDEFKNRSGCGLLGVAGSIYKTYSPSGWFFPDDYPLQRADIWHSIKNESENKIHLYNKPSSSKTNIEEVVVLDGCWLFSKKEITDKYKFDDKLLKGYHCYDLDYSLQVGQEYKLGVIYDLNLIHLSEGSFDYNWVVETFKLQDKWASKLPICVNDKFPSSKKMQDNEFKAFQFIMGKVFDFNAPLLSFMKLLYSPRTISLMGWSYWFKVNQWTWASVLKRVSKSKK